MGGGHPDAVVNRPRLLHPQIELSRRSPRLRRAENNLGSLDRQRATDLLRVDVSAENDGDHAEVGLEHGQFGAAAVLRDAVLADDFPRAVPKIGPRCASSVAVGVLWIAQPADDDVTLVLSCLLGDQSQSLPAVFVVGDKTELGHDNHIGAATAGFVQDLGEFRIRTRVRTMGAMEM